MAQPNGLSPGPGGAPTNGIYSAGGMNGANASVMPPAGHYADMQTIMQNMETLSGWLQQNREEWAGLQESLARVEGSVNAGRLPQQQEPQIQQQQQMQLQNGDSAQPHDSETQQTLTALSTALSTAQSRISTLEFTLATHQTLQTLYEETLSSATQAIRQFTYEQTTHVVALHKHYTTLLSQSRNETIEAQLQHQAWQAHLGRLSESVREAVKAREQERRPWVGRIRGLKEENRVLRRMVGWEPAPDSDDEEETEYVPAERGRISTRGAGGGGGGQELVQ